MERTTEQLRSPQPRAESQSWFVRSLRSFRDTRAPRTVWRMLAGLLLLAVLGASDLSRTVTFAAGGATATGKPSITGTAWVGGTLRVVTTDIADEDGLSGATYGYQWVRVDADGMSNATDITSETSDTYVPVEADVGKKVRVKVSFTDDGGDNEELTSDAYPSSGTIEAEAPGICERTRQVRVRILAKIPRVNDCALVTDARLANITGTLDLSGRSIDTLAAGDFAGLTALTTLNLGSNDLTTLPDDVFDGLTALTGLYLNSNELRTLDDDVFAPLPALTDLRLSTNRLTTLPAGVFAGLTELQELNLSNNRLNTLDAGVFAGLTELTTLRLEGNKLTTLDAGVFAGLTALETLRLESNDLVTLDAGVFAGLTELTTLDLGFNDLTTLPDDVFEPLTALTTLELSGNPEAPFAPVADALPDDGTVSHGGGTVTLDGSGSDGGPWGTNVTYGWALTAPTSGVTVRFDDDASATTLVTIEALAADIELTFTLTVTGRGGTDGITPDTDAATVTVTRVAAAGICGRTPVVRDRILGKISGVSNCALVTDALLADITGTLTLTGQNIAALAAGDFAGLTSLRVLNLQNNDLTTLADEVFDGLAGLETLNLNNNDLTTLADEVFDGLAGLETLNLNNNDLTTLFDGLAGLETLNLNNNDLTTLDAGDFAGLPALTDLRLESNSLTTLDAGVFDGLATLETLNLRRNQLQSLPDGVFEPLTALTGLDLRNNRSAAFAPTADAQPDDGTVSSAGGRVTLDGNGSDGGPWGTNVTYSWRQTSGPTSGVRLNDDASVTPEARIPALAADTELTFTLTVTGRGGEDEHGVAPATDTAKVTVLLDPTAGVCGRTPAVRDALIARFGSTLCNAVSDANLASITDLSLSGQEFTALAAGDFAGLTSLETLRLTNTALTALPGGVFDGLNALTNLVVNGTNTLTALSPGAFAGLTALTYLWLDNNGLENLPDGVFSGLTSLTDLRLDFNGLTALSPGVFAGLSSLKTLHLENNELRNLPDGLFEPLTALTTLDLLDNDGAPFSPEAVARPDDGTVPVAGGMVPLDGSDSGGAWGTNVTYGWALTAPTSGVTFDDDASPTPEVTIPALTAGTELTFTLTVTGRGGTDGIDPATDIATVTSTASDDATLSALTVNDGMGDLTLDPTFAPGTFAYAAEVGKAVTTVTLTAMKTDDGASVSGVTLNGNAIADSDFTNGITVPSLLVGDNAIVVTVTAENGASQTYTVTVTRTNSAPTASDGSVTTDEDKAHTFAAVEFNFADPDAGDALASVTVVTLPAAGALELNGTAVMVDQSVRVAGIGDLVFTPEANANGMGYASFTFKVSDGTEESALAYIMTVNVTAVNDPATGMPTISGTARVGETLTAVTTGIADADGPASPTYGYQWIRVDADGTSNATDVVGETADTYIPVEADDGKKLRVKVSFTDDDSTDEELTSDAFPSSGTIEVSADICGRTGVVRRALLALISSVSNCADVTATHLAAIGTLDLSPITALAAGDFAGLTSLTALRLNNNSLATLPDGVFAGLTALRTLRLDDNRLTTLPDGVFVGLTALRTLRLEDNFLATLPDGVFDGLTELTMLTLHRNRLTTLPDGVFDGLTELTTLGLHENSLTRLPDGVFAGLTALETLYLYDNSLTTLPSDGVFDGLTELTTLNLSDNSLTRLPAGVFAELTALTGLSLTGNDGAPFAPKAVALPDDGTVPDAGGTVPLDGSDSGGAWGTNVTYGWALTTPTSGATFNDNTSAMPEVTIEALAADTELTFTLTVTGRGGTDGITPDTDTATVTVTGPPASDDAKLRGLTVNDGTSDLTLDPTFVSATTSYAAEVANAVTTVTLTAMTTDDGASVSAVTLNGNAIADSDFTNGITVPSLLVGDNAIVVTVTAEDTSSTQTYTVTVTRTNNAPTAFDRSVTTDEDTAHTFAEDEFNFADPDAGDALASVRVVTLPMAGGLALDGTAVTLDQAVPAAKIGDLVFTPEANANGMGYASFTFRVSDGTEESALAYAMTVNVTAVEDPATGGPTISGTAGVGQILTAATTDIADLDGLTSPTYGYQWIRVDSDGTSNATDVDGETSDTYVPVGEDVGKKLKVKVSFTDDAGGDEELTSDAYPSTGTIEVGGGICGRTAAVRDELVTLISSVSNCADVTDARLAAITGGLDLPNRNITALTAGDFGGLTSVTSVNLSRNNLTTLPAGVFDGLPALTTLFLNSNRLATLPAGVFAGLPALTTLYLNNNMLTALPDGVLVGLDALTTLRLNDNDLTALPAGMFAGLNTLRTLWLNDNALSTLPDGLFRPLTALTSLQLSDNDGAPFSPEAVARPDDGTVPVAGGMVTLDGSDSGGAWGTNVTYGWALTAPTSGATFNDNTSPTPVVTIEALTAGTELTFTLTVTGRGGTDGIDPATDIAKVTSTASDDATLSALTVNDGMGDLTLDPTFAPGTFAYAAEVGKAVTTVTLTAMKTDDGASVSGVTLNGNAIADSDFTNGITVPSLLVGDNAIVVTVTAEDTSSTQTYTVTVTRTNNAPTASDRSVTTDEDTAHTFAEDEFNFADPDAGDALASVRVVTLPMAGGLALDGTAVTLDQAVPAAKIGDLVFTPEANANGMGYASFTFRVSDGTEESALAYIMTVNVTAVDDPATGGPTISGTAGVGQILTAATTDIADLDGLTSPTYGYQWIRVDSDGTSNAADVAGETADTYVPVGKDVGKKIRVKVSFTDDAGGDEELTSDAYPSTGTIEVGGGICGRTAAVRDELVALISSVSNCADVTDARLAAIRGPLFLGSRSITALTAGDFGGLTSVTQLNLAFNGLTTLPAGVFAGLAALTELYLDANDLTMLPDNAFARLPVLTTLNLAENELTTLPSDVFDGLATLEGLNLADNGLTTLPDDVFDGLATLETLDLSANELNTLPAGVFAGLAALTRLDLRSNRGARFAPEAVAMPDDGTVPVAGGTVTLDGSGSGGAWGTNVTYGWALTDPASGATFNDNTSPTPVVTIEALTAGTKLTFTLTVTGRGGTDGIKPATDIAIVTATAPPASDDAKLRGLTVNDGRSDLTLDPTFVSGTFVYTASVTNAVDEVTLTATVNHAGASVSAVTMNGNAIADSDFTDGITVPSLLLGDNAIVVTVTAEDTSSTQTYTVTVTRAANNAPTASDRSVTTDEDTAHTFAEDEFNFADPDAGDALASVRVVTLPMASGLALDGTAVTLDQAVPAAKIGDLVFTPEANANGMGYASFTFRVSDGTEESALAYAMTVNVTAVEDPATGGPTISGTAGVGQILTAATMDIADVDGLTSPTYGYQWIRVDSDGTSNATDVDGETSDTYVPVGEDVGKKLKVKVSFTDDAGGDEELTSDAYPSTGTIEAAPNAAPLFTSPATFDAAENQLEAVTVAATDSDSDDSVTGYTIEGGADASKFDIGEATGVLTFRVPPNYERAADVASTDPVNGAGNNEYIVTVTATGGTGDRAMTTEQTITATVRNVEEAGTIRFSQGGTRIRAVLNDPDDGVSSATWQWARSSNRNTGWTNIGGATSDRYTPSSGDQGIYLQATVSYDDAHSSGKQAQGISASQIAPPDLRVATLVSGLSIPWDIAFTPDGTMLFTQRAGVLSSRLADGTVQTIDADFSDLFASGEIGLMGIVVDPSFASNQRFYTCQGHTGPEIQVITWTLNAAYTQATRVADPLVGGMPTSTSSGRHGGCRLRFGPEGYLWIATGDAASGTVPQDLTSLGGKVLRVDAYTGAGAPTNPFAPSRVYTYGHRNVQGLALRPGTSQMWSVEHGPSVDDEINLLVAGRNYGWNPVPGYNEPVPGYNESVPMTDLGEYPDAVEAKWSSGSATLATSGGIFLEGNQWGVWEGRLAVATLADSKLRLFEFTPDGAFVSQVVVAELDGAFGRLRTPMLGPDGALYVSTSNGGSSDRILRIAEDDPIPVTLKLTPSSINENGGVSTVTASLDRASSAVTTVTVSAMAVNPAMPGDFTLSMNKTLTITAGQTTSTGTVTITANNNTADTPNKTVRVSGTATNSAGVTGPSDVTLTIIDDDDPPTVTLDLMPTSIGENGGSTTVTARLNRTSSETTTVTVSATAVSPAVSGDFRLSANKTLTITAGQTTSTGTVTITANNNIVDTPNKTVRVSGTATNSAGVTGPSDVTLTIIDDDDPPTVTLDLMPTSIGENGGSTTVTARLNRTSSETTTVTVSATAVSPAVAEDFRLSANKTLTITAGQTTSTGTVRITANNNDADTPDNTVRVSGTADNSHGVTDPDDVTLTLTDDDAVPVMTLEVSPTAIVEAAGNSTVTVRITNGVTFAEDQEIRLTFAGTATKGTDYMVGLERLTLTAGESSVPTTVTTVDDALDDEAETILVTARHGGGVLGAEQTITITDDDASPVILTTSPIFVDENETAVATLTASDADRPAEDLTWRITGGADRIRFRLTADGVLTFAAPQDYEAPDDSDGNGDYEVTVEVSDGANPVEAVFTIRLEDVDGETPGVPAAPVVSSAGVTSVTVTWAAPSNEGPAITDYDYRHQVKSTPGWTEVTDTTSTALRATITGLAEDTEYEVQVRATNAEGDSGWSEAGSGSTDANAAPVFTSSATFTAAENQTTVGTVTATDSDSGDSVPGYTIEPGEDGSTFAIEAATGVLTFRSAPNFEAPTDGGGNNNYVVVVRATSGTGAREKTADQPITVTVTDVAGEAPGVPATPTVTSASVTSVTVTWAAPSNPGPAITSYDLQYRMGKSGDFTTGPQDVSGPSEPITGLAEDTEYEVQVRATNDDGDSGWSEAGSGSTDANAAPEFTSSATFTAAENQTAVGTVTATDSDSGDSVTGYTIEGGADVDVDVRDRGRDRGADVQVGAELRGPDGRRRQQQLRGGGAGDQRHGRAGEDGGPADHGDGDGRGRRGAGRAGHADGDVGLGDECDGDLGCALEPRAGDHELRPAIPHGQKRGLHHRPAGRDRAERADHGACGGHGVRGAGAGHQRRWRQRLVGGGERLDGRQRGAGVHLVGDVHRGGEPDRGGDGHGDGQRQRRQRDGLHDRGRRGRLEVLDPPLDRGTDVQVGAELRGRDGRRQQHVRGGGAGDQRHGRAGEDDGPADHGDGDGRGRRGAGRPGRANGVVGVGDECDGGLGRALERGAGDHELRPAIPHHGQQWGLHRRPAGRERVERADPGACGGHRVRGAGAGHQRRWRQRLVGGGERFDGRERGPGVHLVGDVHRGGEPDYGGDGHGDGQRQRRQRAGLHDRARRGRVDVRDRGRDRGADVQVGAELRGPDGRRRQQQLRGGGAGDQRHGRAGEDGGPADHGDGDGRGRRGAGRAGHADGDVGLGDECDGDLGCALEPRAGDHELRPAIPHGQKRGLHHRPAGRERVERADPGACGGHGVRGAGAGHQRRGNE